MSYPGRFDFVEATASTPGTVGPTGTAIISMDTITTGTAAFFVNGAGPPASIETAFAGIVDIAWSVGFLNPASICECALITGVASAVPSVVISEGGEGGFGAPAVSVVLGASMTGSVLARTVAIGDTFTLEVGTASPGAVDVSYAFLQITRHRV